MKTETTSRSKVVNNKPIKLSEEYLENKYRKDMIEMESDRINGKSLWPVDPDEARFLAEQTDL